jgi:transposase
MKKTNNQERNKILASGIENGYKNELIEKVIQKQEKKIRLQRNTTLSNATTNPTFIRRISLTYYPKVTNKLIKIFKQHSKGVIHVSNISRTNQAHGH